MDRPSGASIRVLHVDDDPEFVELASMFLEREDDRRTVVTVRTASEGIERLADDPGLDCVVSDYDMPGANGIEFLEAVRESHPDLPFVLFTGKGSEEVASDAVSADVTDYLQKERSTGQNAVLANRIGNAVEQHRSKVAFEASQERLSLFIEQSPLGVVEWNGACEIVRLNDAAEEILGYDEAELRGKSWEVIVSDADRAAVDQVIADLLADDGGYHSVNENVRGDGERIICEWHNRVVTDDAGDVVAVFSQFQDVTEHRTREAELERQNDLFTKAQDIADVGAWEHDVETGRDVWTDQVYEIYDIARDADPVPERRFECYHPEDRETIREAFDRAVRAGEPYEHELRIVTDDGQRWVQTRGDPRTDDGVSHVRGTVQDVTALKGRERQFESLHDASRTLMRATSRTEVARVTIDAAKDILGYVNATVRLVDEDGEVLRTFATTEMNVAAAGERPDYRVDEDTPASRTFRRGEPEIQDRLHTAPDEYDRGDLRSGLYVPIGDHGVFSCGERETGAFDDTDVDLIAVLTKLAAAALTRIRSNQRLRVQNERLEEFASVVSHDLRNPLNVAEGRLALAREECDSDHLEHVADALERSDALIDDFLSRARVGDEVVETTTCDLAEAVASCWRNVETGDATLRIETGDAVRGDPDRLQRLLENLVRNSVEHGSTSSRAQPDDVTEQSSVGSQTTQQSDDAGRAATNGGPAVGDGTGDGAGSRDGVTVTVGSLDDGFYVADDGPGIPETERASVFEAGYTTAENGTGFGLHIVKRAVDAHGWTVRVTESDGGGARFEVRGVEFA